MITGIKTIASAQVTTTKKKGRGYEANVQIPASLATMAAGIPLPVPERVLDVSAGGNLFAATSERTSFVAPGEQVFAVQYHKVRISWLSGRDVKNTYLESGNRWKVYLGGKGGYGDIESILYIQLDVAGQEHFARKCEVLNLAGQEYLRFR
ncbi:hypothetical protein VMCG_10032 [Cytospora schulzeri]|uniref:Uncharacterized protein n=1 Tax=Cytospora schulzeri TaxID=448051 RepID=A0A423VHZ9_9PEZI|nr:hypothetical protein VMCG_10032 [Valsa malicola]